MLVIFRPALRLLIVLTVLTGVVYPFMITGLAQIVFPGRANGSLIEQDGKVVGSRLIGQPFDDPRYFWGRPSATSPIPYNAAASSGSNIGPSSTDLHEAVRQRVEDLYTADPDNMAPIPVDLVTASASGLDPHISVAAVGYQVPRIARIRGLSEETILSLVGQYTEGRVLGFLGESRVNVLGLNLALDKVDVE